MIHKSLLPLAGVFVFGVTSAAFANLQGDAFDPGERLWFDEGGYESQSSALTDRRDLRPNGGPVFETSPVPDVANGFYQDEGEYVRTIRPFGVTDDRG